MLLTLTRPDFFGVRLAPRLMEAKKSQIAV